jgi:divalent metal cation (Fe/Co/Zn/Cd) transporter
MDGVEAGTIDTITRSARGVEGVRNVADVRARWLGHGISADLAIDVSPDATVAEAHDLAERVRHELSHDVEHVTDVTIETRPASATDGSAPKRGGAAAIPTG